MNLTAVAADSAIRVATTKSNLTVEWPSDEAGQMAATTFRLTDGKLLIESFIAADGAFTQPVHF